MNNLIKIVGQWDEGYVLSEHMISSQFIGYDANGRERYNSKRSVLGELLYQFKYKQNKNELPLIIKIVKEKIKELKLEQKVDVVIPVPASNKNRIYQPVYILAQAIARQLNKKYIENVLEKTNDRQAKDGKIQENSIIKNINFNNPTNVLVIDDLYSTGNTLNEVVRTLKNDSNVKKVYCLVMTKTKRGGNN